MVIVHGTKKLLDRLGGPTAQPDDTSDGALGSWYATALLWRPHLSLFVNETTLLPILVPLAPAATLLHRFAAAVERHLAAHGVSPAFIDAEVRRLEPVRLAKTANRSVVGVMNDFTYLLGHYRRDTADLDALSLRLARTPSGPLARSHGFPDGALAALAEHPSQ